MRVLFSLVIAAASLAAGPAEALDIRFYPGERAYAYEMDAAHGASSLIVHNVAIINDGDTPIDLREVSLDLMAGDRALDRRTLGADELTRAAAGTAGIAQAGLLDALAFQFGQLPAGVTLSADLTLAPNEAMLLTSHVFAYRGARDALRVSVNGGAAEASLPIRTGVSQTQFAFPLRGRWYNGAGASFHSHHRWTPMEEFAFDFVRLDENGRTHRRTGTRFQDYYAYNEPVFAAAAGHVVLAVRDEAEDAAAMKRPEETIEAYFARLQEDQFTRLARGAPGIGGNQVMIDHGNGEFSFYAHLKPGSVSVREGDQVAQGQRIGAVGSSGNSTEPHLHFHVCNSADPLMCAGIPVQWQALDFAMPDPPRAPQTGDILSRAGE